MPTDTFCSDTLYVHTDPDGLPSFAEECSLSGTGLRIHTTKRKKHSKFTRACVLLRVARLALRTLETPREPGVCACEGILLPPRGTSNRIKENYQPMSISGKGQNNDIRPEQLPACSCCTELPVLLGVTLQFGPLYGCACALILAARSSSCLRLISAQSLRPGKGPLTRLYCHLTTGEFPRSQAHSAPKCSQ